MHRTVAARAVGRGGQQNKLPIDDVQGWRVVVLVALREIVVAVVEAQASPANSPITSNVPSIVASLAKWACGEP
jgi:hypothetical protein